VKTFGVSTPETTFSPLNCGTWVSSDFRSACEREFAELHRKLDRLDEAIRGNGHPGINVRLDRLEQDAKRQAKLIWLIVGAGITAATSGIITWITG
jgi:hypothetical protein